MDFARRYRFELAFAVVLFGVLGVFGGTWARQVQLRSARGELLHMVDGLRVAEIGYHRKHGNYLAVPAHPGAPPGEAAPWVAPDGLVVDDALPVVHGRYTIDLVKGGFRVIGEVDADGDGAPARAVATEDEAAKRESGPDVF
jgi:hypothetical protein